MKTWDEATRDLMTEMGRGVMTPREQRLYDLAMELAMIAGTEWRRRACMYLQLRRLAELAAPEHKQTARLIALHCQDQEDAIREFILPNAPQL